MAGKSAPDWQSIIRTAAAVFALAISIAVFVIGSGAVYNNWYKVPNVVYTVLPCYDLEGSTFGGVEVENRGRATAHGVLIQVGELGCTIERYGVKSDELWELKDGGTGRSSLTIWLDRMASGSRTTIVLLTPPRGGFDNLVVTTEEGPGRLATEDYTAVALTTAVTLGITVVLLVSSLIGFAAWRRFAGLRRQA